MASANYLETMTLLGQLNIYAGLGALVVITILQPVDRHLSNCLSHGN